MYPEFVEIALAGDARRLRQSSAADAPSDASRPALLILALDGVRRDALYELLKAGKLPGLQVLLGGSTGAALSHAYLSEAMVAPLPTSTAPGWSSAFTGAAPSEHGIVGNEFFVRDEARYVALIPMSFRAPEQVLRTYTEGAVNNELQVPTVYERMRAREPGIRIWVSMSQVFAGADRLLLANRGVAISAFRAYVEHLFGGRAMRAVYAAVDEEVMENVVEELDEEGPPPDVLVVYIPGTDQYGHIAPEGPKRGVQRYLAETLDPLFAALHAMLHKKGALENRYVVLVADHGMTDLPRDEDSSFAGRGPGTVPDVLSDAGFKVRPFGLDVSPPFDAALAYQGALAYVYLADRSTCAAGGACDWKRPPRYEEDLLVAAEALFKSLGHEGEAIELLLVRARRSGPADRPPPFEVYLGGGRTAPLGDRTPSPHYLRLEERLGEMSEGKFGDRAGDILLVARSNAAAPVPERTYFSKPHEAGHGSPTNADSEIPFIVAHPALDASAIEAKVAPILGEKATLSDVAEVLFRLRFDSPEQPAASGGSTGN